MDRRVKLYSALNVVGWVVVMPVLLVLLLNPFINFSGWPGASALERQAAKVALLPPRLTEHGSLPPLTAAPRPESRVPVHVPIAAVFQPAVAVGSPRAPSGGGRDGAPARTPRQPARRPSRRPAAKPPTTRVVPPTAPSRPRPVKPPQAPLKAPPQAPERPTPGGGGGKPDAPKPGQGNGPGKPDSPKPGNGNGNGNGKPDDPGQGNGSAKPADAQPGHGQGNGRSDDPKPGHDQGKSDGRSQDGRGKGRG